MDQVDGPVAAGRLSGSGIALFLCFLVAVQEGFDIQAIALAGPQVAKVAGLAHDQLGIVFSMANVGLVIGAMFGGWIADRIGRKPVLICATIIFGVFTIVTAMTTGYGGLLVARALTGIGFGAALPNMIAIAVEVSAPHCRARATTAIFCGMPLGGGIAAIYIANLPTGTDWRSLFLAGGIAPLLLAVLMFFLMKETRFEKADQAAKSTKIAYALFGAGRAIPTVLIWVTFFFTLLLLYVMGAWLPSMAATKGLAAPLNLWLGPLRVGINPSFAFSMCGAVGALVMGAVVDRVGFRLPTLIAYLAMFAAMIGLANSGQLSMVLLYAGIAGFCVMGAQYSLYSVATSYYPIEAHGVGAGFATASGRLGAVVGPTLFGVLLGQGVNVTNTILATATAAAIAGISVFFLGLRRPRLRQVASTASMPTGTDTAEFVA